MTTKIYYPNSVSQTSGGHFRKFKDLNNVKKGNNSFAVSESLIAGKTGTYNRPSTVIATDFKINLPVGAQVTSVVLEYAHQKVAYQGGIPNLPAPKLEQLDVTGKITNSKTGLAPTGSMKQLSKEFYNYKLPLSLNSLFTNKNFGFKINYPANANTNPGYLRIRYIRLKVTYVESKYFLSVKKVDSQNIVNNNTNINVSISNLNKTDYNPSVTIKLPAGVSYNNKINGNGNISASGSTLTWKPALNKNTGSNNITLSLKLNTLGSKTITVTESISNSTKKTLTFVVVEKQEETNVTPSEGSNTNIIDLESSTVEVIYLKTEEEIELELTVDPSKYPPEQYIGIGFFQSSPELLINGESNSFISNSVSTENIIISSNTPGRYMLEIYEMIRKSDGTINRIFVKKYEINVLPTNLTVPGMSILQLSEEECNRLGDGYVYKTETLLKVITEKPELMHDFFKNFRLGVFNAEIPSDVVDLEEHLFNNVEWWSNRVEKVNTFEKIICEWTYHKEYPVYILFTSAFNEYYPHEFEISFTEPCTIESDVYNGKEPNGNFPVPILNILSNDEISQLTIDSLKTSNPIVLYDLPFEDEFGTNDELAIRGISLKMNLKWDNDIAVLAKIKEPSGRHGERSIILYDELYSNESNEISIGGETDLWGFTIGEMKNLKDWELELQFNNLFSNENGMANIELNNIQLIFHFFPVEAQRIPCLINGENIAWYGMFLQKVDIPAGLKTDTNYIEIDGVDSSNAYRQNIVKKELELEFSVFGCTLEETTNLIKHISKLLTNERDELNRPIPKTIEFPTLYPGEYWEYILVDPIDSNVETADYESKTKLIIPAGTSFSKNETVTNTHGHNSGIAKVNPIIVAIPLSDSVEITELNSKQKFNIGYNFDDGDMIQIDCISRKVLLKKINETDNEGIDITSFVDYNSDWFILNREYAFESNSSIIQTVSFTERG